MHDIEKALRKRFECSPVWPVSRHEMQTILTLLDMTRESLRELYEVMADSDPEWIKSDLRAWKARNRLDQAKA